MSEPPNSVMVRVSDASAIGRLGNREGARQALLEIWNEIGPAGPALERVAIAHAMADTQDDLHDELDWDLRALDAAGDVTDDQVSAQGMAGTRAALYPSLHLNLADVYERLGSRDNANEHVAHGRRTLAALADDGYKAMIREGLNRVEERLRG